MAFNRGKGMTRERMLELSSLPTKGYWSELGGVEVKEITEDDDGNTIVSGVIGTFAGHRDVFSRRVQYTLSATPREFIEFNRHRLYLDECIRNPL